MFVLLAGVTRSTANALRDVLQRRRSVGQAQPTSSTSEAAVDLADDLSFLDGHPASASGRTSDKVQSILFVCVCTNARRLAIHVYPIAESMREGALHKELCHVSTLTVLGMVLIHLTHVYCNDLEQGLLLTNVFTKG